MRQFFFIFLGIMFTVVGVVGIFVPLLPTTPLLLAALFFFTRSSPKLKNWLLTNKFLKNYLNPYLQNHKVPKSTKIRTIIVLWITLFVSGLLINHNPWILFFLALIGVGVTLHILRLK